MANESDKDTGKMVYGMMKLVAVPPGEELQVLMSMMEEWLRGVIVDTDSPIDIGGGDGKCDLAIYMNDRRILITLEESPFQVSWKDQGQEPDEPVAD